MSVGLLALGRSDCAQLSVEIEAVRIGCAKVDGLRLLLSGGLLRLLLLLAQGSAAGTTRGGTEQGERIPSSLSQDRGASS